MTKKKKALFYGILLFMALLVSFVSSQIDFSSGSKPREKWKRDIVDHMHYVLGSHIRKKHRLPTSANYRVALGGKSFEEKLDSEHIRYRYSQHGFLDTEGHTWYLLVLDCKKNHLLKVFLDLDPGTVASYHESISSRFPAWSDAPIERVEPVDFDALVGMSDLTGSGFCRQKADNKDNEIFLKTMRTDH